MFYAYTQSQQRFLLVVQRNDNSPNLLRSLCCCYAVFGIDDGEVGMSQRFQNNYSHFSSDRRQYRKEKGHTPGKTITLLVLKSTSLFTFLEEVKLRIY